MTRYRIGEFAVDPSDGTLRSPTRVARLEPKVMAVLLVLAAEPGTVVPHDLLMDRAWPDAHVTRGALARTISLLRRTLGDDVTCPRYIETVPKRGYRLLAEVEALPHPDTPAGPATAGRSRWRPFSLVATTAVVIAMMAPTLPGNRRAARRMPPSIESRFSNQTRLGNENAFAYYTRAVAMDRASADAQAGLAIAYAFRGNYLPGRAHWAAVASDMATRAAALDPANVRVTRALAIADFQAGRLRQAAAEFQRAIDLGPDDEPSRNNLGRVLMMTGDVASALSLFEHNIAAAPDRAYGYAQLAQGLAIAGFPREAAAAGRAALVWEPYALDAQMVLARIDVLDSNWNEARSRLVRLREVHPDCGQCVVQLGLIDQLTGDLAGAAERYSEALAMPLPIPAAALRLAQVRFAQQRAREARALVAAVEGPALSDIAVGSQLPAPRWQLAGAAALRGDARAALRWYREAVAIGRRDQSWDRWDPLFTAIRSQPDFLDSQRPFEVEHVAAAAAAGRLPATLASRRD